jgi:hypothetical protein
MLKLCIPPSGGLGRGQHDGIQTELPDKHTLGDSWGLGWIRFGWDGRRLIGRDGNTICQSAFLRYCAKRGSRLSC